MKKELLITPEKFIETLEIYYSIKERRPIKLYYELKMHESDCFSSFYCKKFFYIADFY